MNVSQRTARITMWVLLPFGIYMITTVVRMYYLAGVYHQIVNEFSIAQYHHDLVGMSDLLAKALDNRQKARDPIWIITDIREYKAGYGSRKSSRTSEQ